jgi:copper chaperone
MKCSVTIKVKGMTCGGCVSSVRTALEKTAGVDSANVDLNSGTAEIFFDDTFVDPRKLARVIESAGYQPELSAA